MERKRILFVDDEPKIRKAFSRSFRRSAYDIDLADGGESALAMVKEVDYPVVVTDLRMPGVDGLTLMVRIRAIRPSTCFVVITGAPDLDLKADERIDDAIASVIAKPWDDKELLERLELAFELQKKRQGEAEDTNRFPLLIIDDDQQHVERLKVILSPIAQISTCNRLEHALVRLRETNFDVVVTKLSLPDARGLDAVTRVQRAQPKSAIVVVSEIEDEDIASHALRFGAQDYLHTRTLDPNELIRGVHFARERKVVEGRLTELAHYDSLTGLANRMTLRDRLSVCLAKARRYKEEFALLYIDLDFFKPVNDTYGHETGDWVLQQVAARMRVTIREYDTVARLGGDEFAILIENLSQQAAEEIARRVLQRIRLPITSGEISLDIGASAGLAFYPSSAETIDALVRRADKAMYRAKSEGRNCLCVDGKEESVNRIETPPPELSGRRSPGSSDAAMSEPVE